MESTPAPKPRHRSEGEWSPARKREVAAQTAGKILSHLYAGTGDEGMRQLIRYLEPITAALLTAGELLER